MHLLFAPHLLPIILVAIVGAFLVALGNRIRGGLWGDAIAKRVHWGSTTARIVAWGGSGSLAALLGASVASTVGPWGWAAAVLVVPLFWLGSTAPLFSSIDLGHNDGTFWTDFCHLTLHGVLCMGPAALILPFFGFNPVALVVAALSIAPAYYLAWEVRWRLVVLGVTSIDPPPMGELLFGAISGAAVAITFALGSGFTFF